MGGKSSKVKKPAGGTISDIDRAVLDLKVSRDRLTRYRTKINLDSEKLLTKAKLYKAQNQTTTALNILKLRKLKVKEMDNINEQLLTIESMVTNIQTKEEEKEVLTALRTGKNALQKLHEENTLEDVVQLMEDVEEQNEVERQVNDILNQTGEELSEFEEEELELELQALMGGTVTEPVTEPEEKLELPTVPTDKLPEVEKPEKEPVKKVREGRVAVAS
jgi:charged multivesicular body protein 6